MDFDGIDQFFMYKDFIIELLFKFFKKEEVFIDIEEKDINNFTIDEFAKEFYGNQKYWWLIPFFNPNLDLITFGLKNSINSGEFIKSKIDYVYVQKLKKNYANQQQIENIFDSYYNKPVNKLSVPKPTNVKTIEKFIQDTYKKFIVGK